MNDKSIYEFIAKSIRARRIELGMTQEKLGSSIGSDGQYISKRERFIVKPSMERVYAISKSLNCLPYSLLPPGDVPDDITQEIRIITKLQNCTKGQKDFIEKYVDLYLESHK